MHRIFTYIDPSSTTPINVNMPFPALLQLFAALFDRASLQVSLETEATARELRTSTGRRGPLVAAVGHAKAPVTESMAVLFAPETKNEPKKTREGSAVSGAFFDENEHFSTFFMRFLEND